MLNGNLFYTQVVGPIPTQQEYDYDAQPWRFEFRDIPDAATRSAVTSRLMTSAILPRGDVVVPTMLAWGYK